MWNSQVTHRESETKLTPRYGALLERFSYLLSWSTNFPPFCKPKFPYHLIFRVRRSPPSSSYCASWNQTKLSYLYSLISILILLFQLRLVLPAKFLPSGLTTKTLYRFLFPPCALHLGHLYILDLTNHNHIRWRLQNLIAFFSSHTLLRFSRHNFSSNLFT